MIDRILGDRYEIRQQLGKKAGRRTLLARDRQTQQLVVVKLLSFGGDLEWDDLKLFEREAETLKSLSHPAIPRYLDYFELDSPNGKGFALVQSYIEAKSLEEHLKAGRTFTEAEVREIAKAILEILIYLHGRQPPVIHRDIKPSNILLGDRENSIALYLVDFGSVQTLAAREGETITVVGTYGYMPPEQFGGRAVPASDLYSLGATLIYLVTGRHPADLPQKDLRIEFEQFTNVSLAFSKWLTWMTEPSLDRRLASAQKALPALEKPHLEDAVSLVTNKPPDSKISVSKNKDKLEILIPPQGFVPHIVFLCLFAIAWNSGVFAWTIITLSTVPFGINLFFALFSLPFWGVGISLVLEILFALFGRVRFRIDSQQISLIYKLFGLKFSFRPGIFGLIGFNYGYGSAPTNNISKLELLYSSDGAFGTILIWIGTKQHQFEYLSAPEIEWLASELSDWLNLPIQVRKQPND